MLTAPTTPCCLEFLLCVGFIVLLPSLLLVELVKSLELPVVCQLHQREHRSLWFSWVSGQLSSAGFWLLLWPESLAWALLLLPGQDHGCPSAGGSP